MVNRKVKRGEIWYAKLPLIDGSSVQGGIRPVLVYQTNWINERSPTVNVLAITSKNKRTDLRYHVELPYMRHLPEKSMVLAEQIFTVDQNQLFNYRCTLPEITMKRIDRARRYVSTKNEGKLQARHRKKKIRYDYRKISKVKTTKKK